MTIDKEALRADLDRVDKSVHERLETLENLVREGLDHSDSEDDAEGKHVDPADIPATPPVEGGSVAPVDAKDVK